MRTLCDSCESAAAVLFCAADEAALCQSCDNKIHMCNKLANRHVRVGLAEPSGVPRCDICENAPAFFYCEIDGSSLCLQCDTVVHVGGKRTHGRYLVLRQQIEFPGDKVSPVEELDESKRMQNQNQNQLTATMMETEDQQKQGVSGGNADGNPKTEKNNNMIDLNMKPNRIHEHASNTQDI